MKKILIAGLLFVSAYTFNTQAVEAQRTGSFTRELTEEQKAEIKKLRTEYERKVRALASDVEELMLRIHQLRKSSDPKNKKEIDAIRAEIRRIQKEIYDAGVRLYNEIIRIHKLGKNNGTRP